MVEYSICKTWCFSQYAPRRQSWSGSVGKVDGSLPSRRWAGSSPDHSFDLVILITITKMTIIKQWCEDLLGVAYFTKYPKSLHPLDSECCLTAVIIPSNLSYSHKYRAYSYLLKTQNIWYKFLSEAPLSFLPMWLKRGKACCLMRTGCFY